MSDENDKLGRGISVPNDRPSIFRTPEEIRGETSFQRIETLGPDGPVDYTIATIPDDWQPTSENINDLPDPVRKFIHDIETLCDPAGIVRENAIAKDTIESLTIRVKELEAFIDKVRTESKLHRFFYNARKDYEKSLVDHFDEVFLTEEED